MVSGIGTLYALKLLPYPVKKLPVGAIEQNRRGINMFSENIRPSAFKTTRGPYKLSPNYLYEIDLISKPSWLSRTVNPKGITLSKKTAPNELKAFGPAQ